MRTISYAKELSALIDAITADEFSDSIDYDKTSERIVDIAYRHGHSQQEINSTIDNIFKVLETRINAQLRKDRTQ